MNRNCRLAESHSNWHRAKKLWLDQIDHRQDDVRVLVHAARFFLLSDKALALTLINC